MERKETGCRKKKSPFSSSTETSRSGRRRRPSLCAGFQGSGRRRKRAWGNKGEVTKPSASRVLLSIFFLLNYILVL